MLLDGRQTQVAGRDLDYLEQCLEQEAHLQQSTIGTKAGAGTAGEIER